MYKFQESTDTNEVLLVGRIVNLYFTKDDAIITLHCGNKTYPKIFAMSNYSFSISKYKTKDGKIKYRVFYSYISPKTGEKCRTCKRGFNLEREAKAWTKGELPDIITQLESKKIPSEKMTMAELIKEYLEDASLDENIQATTLEIKKSSINNHILSHFKDLVVHELKARDIKDWQREFKKKKKKDGTPYSATYLRTVENQLSAIFNYAVKYYDLDKNPIAERIGSKDAPDAKIWELDEYRRFQKEIEDKPEYYYAFEIFFWTGVRLGELLAITPNDIDFEQKTLNINKAMRIEKGKLVLAVPKTKNGYRKIALPDFLVDEIKEYLESINVYDENMRIFDLSKTQIRETIKRKSEAAGIHQIKIHGLRHSHASLLEQLGVPPTALKRRLGHATKDKKDVTTIYTHSYSSADAMVARLLDEVALGNIDPNNILENILRSRSKGVMNDV